MSHGSSDESTIKGVQQTLDVYVGRWDRNLTVEHMMQYILEELKIWSMDGECIYCEDIYVKAFKFAVGGSAMDNLLDENRWPETVRVRKSHFRKQKQWR